MGPAMYESMCTNGQVNLCVSRFQDEFQILVNGIAIGLLEPSKIRFKRKMQAGGKPLTDDELIFNLEEEHITDFTNGQSYTQQAVRSHGRNQYLKESGSLKLKNSRSPSRPVYRSLRLDKNVLTNGLFCGIYFSSNFFRPKQR